jgi:hypothetical protein
MELYSYLSDLQSAASSYEDKMTWLGERCASTGTSPRLQSAGQYLLESKDGQNDEVR